MALAVLPLPVPSREEEEEPFLPPLAREAAQDPPSPGPCPPALCSPPTPAGAGRANATFLIYSTPLEHARDPNGAPGTAACTGLERSSAPGSARGIPDRHKGLQSRQQKATHRGDNPSQGDPRAHSSAGCQRGKARPQPRPRLQGKAWRAKPGSNARKIRNKSWKTQKNKVSGGG